MPVIPTYQEKEQLNPDTRGMPHPTFTGAPAAALQSQGQALQSLGSSIGGLSALADHFQQKQQQEATFDAGVQDNARRQEQAAFLTEAQNQMPESGAGFHDAVLPKLDEIAEKRFSAMSPDQAERYRKQWGTAENPGPERIGWSSKVAEIERNTGATYQGNQINQAQQSALGEINANSGDPAAVDAVRARVQQQIDNASYLTPIQKAALSKTWSTSALALEAAKRYEADPVAASQALGIPLQLGTSASPAAVFSRMLAKETHGDPGAVSPKGALGLAQLMPDTAREVATEMGRPDIAKMSDGQLKDFFTANPEVNKAMGQQYFSKLLARYNGNQEAAVIAYNAGPARADAWLRKGKDDSVLPAETVDYRDSVIGKNGVLAATVRANSPLGSISFDGDKAKVNGTTFSSAATAADVARQFEGMNERDHRAALSAFIEKACGQKVDPAKIPWCASFADAVLGASGKPTLGSARAADFLNYGTPTNAPSKGDVVVFKSMAAGSSGHVGFVLGIEGDRVRYIAGNDDNKVQESTLPLSKVAGFRQPPPAGEGAPDPRYVGLDFATRQKIVNNAINDDAKAQRVADQQVRAEQYNVTKAVDDDVASLRATGRGLDSLTPERVNQVLGPQKAQQWQDQRNYAQQVFQATDGLETMPGDAVMARVEQYRPTADQAGAGFANKAAVFKEVHDKAEAVMTQRYADPAAAVEQSPDVKAAQARFQGDNSTAAREGLIEARLGAQTQLGIPDSVRSPIPVAEAKQYASLMRPLTRGQADAANQDQVIEGIVNDIQNKYGKYAKDVLQRVLYQVTLKKDASEVLASAMDRMTKTDSGPLVTADEARRVQAEDQADRIAKAAGVTPPADPYATPFDTPAPPPRQAPSGERQSYTKAIEVLASDPDKNLPFFIQRYGIDRVPTYLRKKADALTKKPEPVPPPAYTVTRDAQGRVSGFAPQ